jgi:catechol 2,3-dioxygenase-like lactoylglutathione lyase family enzyme
MKTMLRERIKRELMRIEKIDHINIRAANVAQTASFFADVLGMEVRPPPGQPDLGLSAWIYDVAGRAAIHVTGPSILYPWEDKNTPPAAGGLGSGRIHHVAFACTGYAEMLARLSANNIAFVPNEVPQAGLRQIFVEESNAILLELNFFGD